jgi:hypothetical protein
MMQGMRMMLSVILLFAQSAVAQESDLIEAARRATGYWNSRYAMCGGRGEAKVWYAMIPTGVEAGWVQVVSDLRIHFRTEKISREERLNGLEFKATTELEPGPYRWWNPKTKAWADWTDRIIDSPALLTKRNGVWTVQGVPQESFGERKPLPACSQAPAGGV